MLAVRVLAALVAALLLQDSPPSMQAAPTISSVQMQAWSTWTKRDGEPYDYRLSLAGDGTASFSGRRGQPRFGEYTAKLHPVQFGNLVEFMREIGAEKFESLYSTDGVYDGEHISITVNYVGTGIPAKVIHEYARSGPIKLWGLQQAIWGVSEHLRWKPVEAESEAK